MHDHRCGRKLFERLRKDDSKLETEQCLSPGQNDTRLSQHLLDFGVKRCVRPVLGLTPRHCAFSMANMEPSHPGKTVPQADSRARGYDSGSSASRLAKDPLDRNKEIEPQRKREGEEG
jgi:hypothetical protein